MNIMKELGKKILGFLFLVVIVTAITEFVFAQDHPKPFWNFDPKAAISTTDSIVEKDNFIIFRTIDWQTGKVIYTTSSSYKYAANSCVTNLEKN